MSVQEAALMYIFTAILDEKQLVKLVWHGVIARYNFPKKATDQKAKKHREGNTCKRLSREWRILVKELHECDIWDVMDPVAAKEHVSIQSRNSCYIANRYSQIS